MPGLLPWFIFRHGQTFHQPDFTAEFGLNFFVKLKIIFVEICSIQIENFSMSQRNDERCVSGKKDHEAAIKDKERHTTHAKSGHATDNRQSQGVRGSCPV